MTDLFRLFFVSSILESFESLFDIQQLKPENFDDETYRCYQKKTGNYAVVDIRTMSIDKRITQNILDRYGKTCPWQSSYRNLATTLKHFFRAIGMTENVVYIEPTVSGSKTVCKPKWDIVTMHSARRTFVTINSSRGLSAQTLMRASGHATLSSFSRYVCA